MSLSKKLLVIGIAFVALFAVLLLFAKPDEASLLTRTIFFVGLIPPAICFGAGFGMGLFRRRAPGAGIANGAALLIHTVAMVVVLQRFFA